MDIFTVLLFFKTASCLVNELYLSAAWGIISEGMQKMVHMLVEML